MVVTETDVEDYPCMFLFGGNGTRLDAQFPPVVLEARLKDGSDRNEEFVRKADYIATTAGTRTFPWRLVTIDPDDRALLENYLPYQLARPAIEGDASWVKPGKISWEWWHSLTLHGVDFKSGVNTQTYKYYIDFASEYGLEYILLDEGWSVSTLNIKEPRAEVDVEELVRYGREKGVDVILWTLWNPMKKDLTGILDTYREWGVKGIKIDFMQRSDQEMVNFYEEIARACFDRELLVDYHGSFAPKGLQRKYPNVMSFEGVYGMENDKSSVDISPAHDCVLPFTRMVAGPMDYTPGATINSALGQFRENWTQPMSQGTRAHQAALYVVFESPLQMLCDSPSHYMRNPELTRFIAAVPTVWDETRALHASAGEYACVARRNGDKWYIGAITDWTGREMELDLSFLDEGNYTMEFFEDGVNADTYAADFRTGTREVSAGDKITVSLAPGGGWAAISTIKN
jgi:alpha-glucosidase